MIEIVLPSGRFAQIREPRWIDRVATKNDNIEAWILGIACRCVTIDGEALTVEQAADMTLVEANPIIEQICKFIADSLKSKGIA